MTEERCLYCGEIIPEGRMICPTCEHKYLKYNHAPRGRIIKKFRLVKPKV